MSIKENKSVGAKLIFPVGDGDGLTLREYLISLAIAGRAPNISGMAIYEEEIAENAIAIADAIIMKLDKGY